MIIYRTETGFTYNVEVGPKDTVDQLKSILFKLTSIPVSDQILLCDGHALKHRTLEENGLFMNNRNLFLFDKRILDSDVPPPDATAPFIEMKAAPVPPLPVSQELDKSPLLWSLMKYENQFLSHLSTYEAHKRASELRLEFCKVSQNERTIQFTGLQAAIINLAEQYTQIVQGYNSFQNYYSQLQRRHEKLIDSFEHDIQRLKETPLHTALKSSGMTSLIDYVPETKLRKWKEECASDHVQLKSKVLDLEKLIFGVKDSVEAENRTPPEMGTSSLSDYLRKASDLISDINMRYQVIATDYKTVKDRLQQALSLKNPSNKILWELCEGLEEASKSHMQHLYTIREQEDIMKSIVNIFVSSKTDTTQLVYTRLRIISHLQSRLRDIAGKVYIYHETLLKQKQAFHQLVYVQSMPKAYHSAIEEVVRRRKYGKKVAAFLQKVNEILAKLREEEKTYRVNFLNTYGSFIPKDLIPGLGDNVPHLELNMPPFDTTLPVIDYADKTEDSEINLLFSESSKIQELAKENERLMNELKVLKSSTVPSMLTNLGTSPPPTSDFLRLQADLVESQESTGDYKKRIENLEAKLSTTYSQIEQAEQLVKQFKEMYEQSQVRLSQVGSMQSHTEQLDEKLKDAQKEILLLSEKLKDLQHKYDDKESEFIGLKKSLEEQNQKQEKIIGDSQLEVDNLRKSISDYQTQVQTLEKQISEKDAQISELTMEISQLKEKFEKDLENMSQTITSNDVTIKELQHELEEKNSSIDALKIQLEEKGQSADVQLEEANSIKLKLEHDLEACRQQMEIESQQNQEQTLKLKKANIQLEEVNSIKLKLEQDLEACRQQIQIESQEHQEQILKLKENTLQLEDKLKTSEQNYETAIKETQEYISKYESMSKQFQEISKENANLTDINETLQSKNAQLEMLLQNSKHDKQESKELLEQFNLKEKKLLEELEKLKKSNEAQEKKYSQEIAKYQSTSSTLTEELSQLSTILEQSKTERLHKETLLNEQLTMYKEKSEKSQAMIEKLTSQLKQSEDHCSKIEKERASLAAQCEVSEKKIAKMEQDLNSVLQETTKEVEATSVLHDKMQQLKAELDNKSKELEIAHKNVNAVSQRYLTATQQLQSITKKNNETEKQLAEMQTETHRKQEDYVKLQNLNKIQQEELNKYRQGYLEIENLLPVLKNSSLVISNLGNSNYKSEDIIQVLKSRLQDTLNDYEKREAERKESIQILRDELIHEKEDKDKKINELKSHNTALTLSLQEVHKPSVATKDFKANDYLLFLWKDVGKEGHYEAYNEGCPHYYLSPMVYEIFADQKKKKSPILGQVIEIMPAKATANNNPFGVPKDTTFHEVIVTK